MQDHSLLLFVVAQGGRFRGLGVVAVAAQAETRNWFRAGGTVCNVIMEGLNTNAQLTTTTSFDFRTHVNVEIALVDVPEPNTEL